MTFPIMQHIFWLPLAKESLKYIVWFNVAVYCIVQWLSAAIKNFKFNKAPYSIQMPYVFPILKCLILFIFLYSFFKDFIITKLFFSEPVYTYFLLNLYKCFLSLNHFTFSRTSLIMWPKLKTWHKALVLTGSYWKLHLWTPSPAHLKL